MILGWEYVVPGIEPSAGTHWAYTLTIAQSSIPITGSFEVQVTVSLEHQYGANLTPYRFKG